MQPHSIFIHCTATRPDWWEVASSRSKVHEVRRWHVDDNGWSDIGYHWLIDRDGTVVAGRPEARQGAHAKGYNKDTLAIALFGGHGSTSEGEFLDNFTAAQEAALLELIKDIKGRYPSITSVRGHNEVSSKACPGFQVRSWFAKPPAPPAAEIPAPSGLLAAFLSFLGSFRK